MTVHQIYAQTMKPLSVADRLRLAALILNDIPPHAVVDYSDGWSKEDLRDFQQASWEHIFGSDHVVFATDYPYGRNRGEYFLESRRRFVDEAHIDPEARQNIYEDNAKKLLQLGS